MKTQPPAPAALNPRVRRSFPSTGACRALATAAAFLAGIAFGQSPSANAGWIKSPKNPMLSLGKPGEFDHHNLFAPCVVKEGGKYFMFYSGGPTGPRTGGELVNYQISLALSDDGETWRKTGKPILPLGERDNFHATPALLRTPEGELFKRDGLWHMVFCGNRPDDVELATSPDGINWKKDPRSPIYKRAYAPHIMQVGEEIWMYYVAKPRIGGKPQPWEIHLATGKDLHSLKPHPGNPVLSLKNAQSWEKRALVYPYVIREGDTWALFYAAYWTGHPTANTSTAIGMATSKDGIAWAKYSGNPVLTPTPDSPYDAIYTSSQCVIRDDKEYKLYYGARIDMVHKYYSIGLATKRGPLLDPSSR